MGLRTRADQNMVLKTARCIKAHEELCTVYSLPFIWSEQIYMIIIIIIIIIEFFTSQLWLGNIHLSWDVIINRIRLGCLTCSLKSFLQLHMCKELHIFAVVYVFGCKLSLVRVGPHL